MQLFALNATRRLGEAVAHALDTSLAVHEEREFEDGEHKARPLVSVQGRDVYVIHSLLGDDAQRVDELLLLLLLHATHTGLQIQRHPYHVGLTRTGGNTEKMTRIITSETVCAMALNPIDPGQCQRWFDNLP